MNYICGDNRFEIIERYKNELISATNIEGSPDEMAVLDNILFRFWQMGWLKEQEAVVHCGDCKHYNKKRNWCDYLSEMYDQGEEWFCADGERQEGR